MIAFILNIGIILSIQLVLRWFWFSKYMINFVFYKEKEQNIFANKNPKFYISILLYNILIYILTTRLFFILPAEFFLVIFLIMGMLLIILIDTYYLSKSTINILQLIFNASYLVLSSTLSFIISLLLL